MTISKLCVSGKAVRAKERIVAASLILCAPAYASFFCRLFEEITGEQLPAAAESSVDMLCTTIVALGFALIAFRPLRGARAVSQKQAAGAAKDETAPSVA